MAGEMSQSEVTAENYPGLFEIQEALDAEGIESEARAFDQYQGPFLRINGVCKVWYSGEQFETFVIERYVNGKLRFETQGADRIEKQTSGALKHGVYFKDAAIARIVKIAKKR